MSKIKLIVFDMAGTTVYDDLFVSKAVAKAMNEFNYPVVPQEVEPIMGYQKPLAISMLLDKHEPDISKINDEYIDQIHTRFVEIMMDFYRHSPDVRPIDGVEQVLKTIRSKNIAIGLDTGFSRDIANLVVERLGWLQNGLVQTVVASDEVPHGRPDPYMIYKIMEANGITNSKEVIKVGDTEVDVNEGRNARCLWSIAVTTGAYKREALLPHRPDYIIDSLDELITLIDNYDNA